MKQNIILNITLPVLTLMCVIFLFVGNAAYGLHPLPLDANIGKKAPGFVLNDLSGNRVSLESFRGKPVLLNFWATWCPYCRKERSHLNELHRDYTDRGLVILSVSTDRSITKLKKFMKDGPAEFMVLSDSEGRISKSYNIMGLPSSLLINREGIIKHKFTGFREWNSEGSRKLIETLF
jgi:peroxiredoxin